MCGILAVVDQRLRDETASAANSKGSSKGNGDSQRSNINRQIQLALDTLSLVVPMLSVNSQSEMMWCWVFVA